ncbi:NAD synthetase [Halomicronema sp. CCY15110]
MDTLPNLDWLLGGIALVILLGGLWLLLDGVKSMGDD